MRTLIAITLLTCSASVIVSATSLWNAPGSDGRSMFQDRIANQIGDILTVVVSESTTLNKNVQKASSTASSVAYSIEDFFFPNAVSGLGKHNGALPQITLNPTDSFAGNGSINNTSSVDTNVTVIVVDTLPNGNLIVEGAKQVDMSGEVQYAILRGIVRSDDISTSNTVSSSRIANAQVKFMSRGELAKTQKKGWLVKLMDLFNIW